MSAVLGVTIYMDNTTELTELFAAVLAVPTTSYNLGVRPGIADNATVEIQDTNEGMYVRTYTCSCMHCTDPTHLTYSTFSAIAVFFDPVSYNVTEGGNASLTLRTSSFSFDFSFAVFLMYTDGLATSGRDYTPAIRRVAFEPQQGQVKFQLPTIHDEHAELTEDFQVTIFGTTLPESLVTVGQDTATVNILDNDGNHA